MTLRSSWLALLLCLLPLAAVAQNGMEKYGQRMRTVARAPHGGYRLCQPMRGRGFRIEGSGRNEGVLLGYSPQGDLGRALEHPLFRLLLEAYDDAGADVTACRVVPASVRPSVEPLLTDSWNQPEPYNICAPMIGGRHCQVGCVALAMAQVMRYWHWPSHGTGTHTYVDSLGCGQALTADFAHEYRWDLMRDSYEGEVDSTNACLLEAGRLLRDCGVAVDMRYGLEASAARSVKQAIALHTWFGYDAGMQLYYRDFFSRAEWEGMLMEQLSVGRPVLFAAQSAALSHALVCDGYDEDGLFHMNMGLGGDADGYYYLPHFTPKQPEWYDPESAERGLNLLQSMTVGVRPAGDSTVRCHSLGLASIEPVVATATRQGWASVATSHLANVGWNAAAPGSVSLVLLRGDEVVAPLVAYPHAFSLEALTDSTYTDTLSFQVSQSLPEGLYQVRPAVREAHGGWTLARASMGTPPHVLLRVTQDSLLLHADSSRQARLSLLAWEFPDSVRRNQRPPFSFTLRNDGPSEYCGRLSILLHEQSGSGRYRALQYQGVWLSPGEEVTYTYRWTPVPQVEGDYELCLAYDRDLFTDSLVWLSPQPLQAVHVLPAVPSQVDGRQAADPSVTHRYGLDGLPQATRQRGVSVERRNGRYRKIMIR